VLDEEQPVAVVGVQVPLDQGRARRAVVDDLHQHAARDADHHDRHGPAVHARLGVLDGVGDELGRQ
jgi:hypothetical protein